MGYHKYNNGMRDNDLADCEKSVNFAELLSKNV